MTDFKFSTSLDVRYSDLDAQGHLNHARYFSFMEQARFNYMLEVGLWKQEQGFAGVGQIVASATCDYKRPAQLGDEVRVWVRTTRLGQKSLEMDYLLMVDEVPIATGSTVQVAYDYAAGQSMPLPDSWRVKIRQFEHSPDL